MDELKAKTEVCEKPFDYETGRFRTQTEDLKLIIGTLRAVSYRLNNKEFPELEPGPTLDSGKMQNLMAVVNYNRYLIEQLNDVNISLNEII